MQAAQYLSNQAFENALEVWRRTTQTTPAYSSSFNAEFLKNAQTMFNAEAGTARQMLAEASRAKS